MTDSGTMNSVDEEPVNYAPAVFLGGLALLVAGIIFVWVPLVIVGLVVGAVGAIWHQNTQEARTNPDIVCKHCQTGGTVHTGQRIRKRGISGGKATGALFTGGLSMFATGLSRKEAVTHMWCDNCGVEWDE